MAEQGYAEAQVTPWFGIVVPAATPQPIVERISKVLDGGAGEQPEVREKLDTAGCEPKGAPLAPIRRHHQGRRRAMGQGGQGGRHHRRLNASGRHFAGFAGNPPCPPENWQIVRAMGPSSGRFPRRLITSYIIGL